MMRHTRVGLIREHHDPTPPASRPDGVAITRDPDRLCALVAAVEQLADAIDAITEPGTPTSYVDDHVQRAREELRHAWDG